MVFLVGLLCAPAHINSIDEPALVDACKQCRKFLHSLESHSRSARRFSEVLQVVEQEVFNFRRSKFSPSNHAARSNLSPNSFARSGRRSTELPIGANLGMPNYEAFSPSFQLDSGLDWSISGWIGNSADMTWLSVMPFTENMGTMFPMG